MLKTAFSNHVLQAQVAVYMNTPWERYSASLQWATSLVSLVGAVSLFSCNQNLASYTMFADSGVARYAGGTSNRGDSAAHCSWSIRVADWKHGDGVGKCGQGIAAGVRPARAFAVIVLQ